MRAKVPQQDDTICRRRFHAIREGRAGRRMGKRYRCVTREYRAALAAKGTLTLRATPPIDACVVLFLSLSHPSLVLVLVLHLSCFVPFLPLPSRRPRPTSSSLSFSRRSRSSDFITPRERSLPPFREKGVLQSSIRIRFLPLLPSIYRLLPVSITHADFNFSSLGKASSLEEAPENRARPPILESLGFVYYI